MGRSKKSIEDQKLAGTARDDRGNHDALEQESGPPVMPDWLPEDAKAIWEDELPRMKNRLTPAHSSAFAEYCEAYAAYQNAVIEMDGEPNFVTTIAGNLIQHPGLGALNKAREAFHKIRAKLGANPVDEGKVKAPPKKKKDEPNPWNRFGK